MAGGRRYVKCVICGKQIDKTIDSYQPMNGRYAHTKCAEDKQSKLSAHSYKNLILEKTKEYLGSTFIRYKTENQINAYIKDGKNPKDIYNALIYWFEIKKGDPSAANGGIGIVDYIYDESLKYYKRVEENAERYKNVNENIIQDYIDKRTQIEKTPKRKPFSIPARNKLFILD
jgi:hypothetical protein